MPRDSLKTLRLVRVYSMPTNQSLSGGRRAFIIMGLKTLTPITPKYRVFKKRLKGELIKYNPYANR